MPSSKLNLKNENIINYPARERILSFVDYKNFLKMCCIEKNTFLQTETHKLMKPRYQSTFTHEVPHLLTEQANYKSIKQVKSPFIKNINKKEGVGENGDFLEFLITVIILKLIFHKKFKFKFKKIISSFFL